MLAYAIALMLSGPSPDLFGAGGAGRWPSAGDQAPAPSLQVDLQRNPGADGPLEIIIEGTDGRTQRAIVQADRTSATMTLAFPWTTASCRSDRLVCVVLRQPPASPVVVMGVYRKAVVRGGFREMPAAPGVLQFRAVRRDVPPTGPASDVRIEGRSVLSREGRFVLELPQGRLDLRLEVPGCAALYRFGLETGPALDLGGLRCVPGGSVAGRVRDAASGTEAATCSARVERNSPVPVTPSETGRIAAVTAHAAPCAAGGFFQVTGLAPGRYWLVIESPAHAPSEQAIDVRPGEETYLDTWLTPYRTLHVLVQPETTPDQEPWVVGLRPESSRRRLDVSGSVRAPTKEGRITFSRVAGAPHEVEVLTSSGTLIYSEVHEVSAVGDELVIAIPLVTVTGTMRRGARGVEGAQVTLANDYDRVTYVTGADGTFTGWMRRPDDTVFADVVLAGSTAVRQFEVLPDTSGGSVVRLDLDLGSAALRVRVVDGEGRAIAGAHVQVTQVNGAGVVHGETGASGQLDIEGLEAGTYRVTAMNREHGSSEPHSVAVDNVAATEVTVRLDRHADLRLRVESFEGNPVQGADVRVRTATSLDRRRTDAAGAVDLKLAERSPLALLQIVAPSHMLWSTCRAIPDSRQLTVRLPPLPTGTMVLTPHVPAAQAGPPDVSLWLVSDAGGVYSMVDLGSWRMERGLTNRGELLRGETAEVPGLPAGTYRLVWWPNTDFGGLVSAACAGTLPRDGPRGELQPGETLVLTARPRN